MRQKYAPVSEPVSESVVGVVKSEIRVWLCRCLPGDPLSRSVVKDTDAIAVRGRLPSGWFVGHFYPREIRP